jgi:hypothetical protein
MAPPKKCGIQFSDGITVLSITTNWTGPDRRLSQPQLLNRGEDVRQILIRRRAAQ